MNNLSSGYTSEKVKRGFLLTLAILSTIALVPLAIHIMPKIMSFK